MERFSHAYKKCHKAFSTQKFADDWQKFLEKSVGIAGLLDSDGPNPKRAGGLDKLREKILAAPEGRRGALLLEAATQGKGSGSVAERAASLKMLWHLYLTSERGGQSLWVFSPPVDYTKWVYDEISGESHSFEPKLNKTSETYSAEERKVMSTALAQALGAANNAIVKLASPRTFTSPASAQRPTAARCW